MANTIKLKRSAVSGNIPTTANLELGELAVNTFDGKLYIKKNNGTESIVEVGSAGGFQNTTVTSGSTLTPDSDVADQYNVTALAVSASIEIPTGSPINGQRLTIRIEDNGVARALSWVITTGGYRVIGTTLPTATVASKIVYIGCIYNSTDTFWDVVSVAQQV